MGESGYAILLGILQGTAEFLPISSSGHLIIASWFLDGKPLPLALNVALHLGTVLAVLIYFWRDWLKLAHATQARVFAKQKSFESDVFLPALILGSIPAACIGLLWEDAIEEALHKPQFVIIPLAVVGLLIWWADRKAPVTRKLDQLNFKDAMWIGIAQATALIPGVSRSGATILGGRLCGFTKEDAAKFSFMLGTPAMLGAAMLEGKNILSGAGQPVFYIGFIVSFIVGCLSIGFLMSFLKKFGFGLFAVYRLLLAGAIFWMVG